MLSYPVRLVEDDNDTYLATCPDFPEISTFGASKAEALANVVDAIQEAIAARQSEGKDIPGPSKGRQRVQLPTRVALKLALYLEMRDKGIAKAALARRLGVHRPQIDRLLDIRHHSNLDTIDAALNAIGSRAIVEVTQA